MGEQSDKSGKPSDTSTELAKERTHNAYERTLMAWIRTGLSLIGFGIGIFEVTERTGGTTIFRSSKLVGLLFVILGIASVVMAIQENKMDHERLLNPDITYSKKSSLGIRVGYALIGIGILAVIHIIYKVVKR
jgi:putative membrane protein